MASEYVLLLEVSEESTALQDTWSTTTRKFRQLFTASLQQGYRFVAGVLVGRW